jgi:acetate---CoA ligase (ADP-forming)
MAQQEENGQVNHHDSTPNVRRLLQPSSIAIVGLSDDSRFIDSIAPTLNSGAEMFFVHARQPSVLGHATYPTLTDIGRPIDAVLSTMSAERTAQLAEEAVDLDIGGLVSFAGGFAEVGGAGIGFQERLAAAAQRGGFAVMGPNCLGYINVPKSICLTISQRLLRTGGISLVTQSGAMMSGVAMAAWAYEGCGLNILVSAGNEAVTDLADYVNFFVDDPGTRAIGLIIEKVRRPEAFFAAVRRATEAGKPIVAIKLARNERTRQMAASHTGALTGEAWIYDVAFRQAGIAIAYDIEELVDRLAIIDQLRPEEWTGVEKLGVISMTGGYASLSADLAVEEGLHLPALDDTREWISENFPSIQVPNPLDTTGLGETMWPDVVDKYAHSDDLDALLFIHNLSNEDAGMVMTPVEQYLHMAALVHKPFVIANFAGVPGTFVSERIVDRTAALGRGLRASLRGLQTLGSFVQFRSKPQSSAPVVAPLERPTSQTLDLPEGKMLPFADTMKLFENAGIPVAPYFMVNAAADDATQPPFEGPYVVKLADVGHRTEHNAVRLNVASDTLQHVVDDLRSLAQDLDLPDLVVIQPMVKILGEAFIGVQGQSELGPIVIFGLGGIFVEAMGQLDGRLAPLTREDAMDLLEKSSGAKVMKGFRGQTAWDFEALATILVAVGNLAAAGHEWISSIDINPLIFGPDGFVAVDALCLIN